MPVKLNFEQTGFLKLPLENQHLTNSEYEKMQESIINNHL